MATARPGATFGRTAAGGPVVVGGGSLTASMLDPLAGHARRRPAAAVAWAPVGNPIATLFLLALGTVSAALLVPRWATERAN
jgi:hypothetical protein